MKCTLTDFEHAYKQNNHHKIKLLLSSYVEKLSRELKSLPEVKAKPTKLWIIFNHKKYRNNVIVLEKKALILKHMREIINMACDINDNTSWYYINDCVNEFNTSYEQAEHI